MLATAVKIEKMLKQRAATEEHSRAARVLHNYISQWSSHADICSEYREDATAEGGDSSGGHSRVAQASYSLIIVYCICAGLMLATAVKIERILRLRAMTTMESTPGRLPQS